jgi:hypothetical protein
MPKRWKVLRFGALGAICGLIYCAYINLALLPYAFESFDMTAYLTSSVIRSTATGIAIFVATAIIHNLVIRFRTRRAPR